ncbi:hypothetical protein YK48G_11570 [Lentilactobacillus fungorum]|uniref:Uncharacterized protein n=1 Tax=Lentilactobacillus fungorum TaxID=2201250 RepID=A0ABQ3VXU9_9LACO|nr:hypothetical protein [Lentilactobacillus fungorum]GHP13732.1 hypothetical protein YK48G_11570 [Lentilactobacillus fungorum]
MGLFKRLFDNSKLKSNVTHTDHSDFLSDAKFATQNIPIYWIQYEESLYLLMFTHNCRTYFDRKDFVVPRLGMLRHALGYVGNVLSFVDLHTQAQVIVTTDDIDKIVQTIKSPDFDQKFINNYCEALDYKLGFVKNDQEKLVWITRWQQRLKPFEKRLSTELVEQFKQHCLALKRQLTTK